MKNSTDYNKYECPYSHLEKEIGHTLNGPEGYEDVYGVWCTCGFRAPIFYLDPEDLNLKLKSEKTGPDLNKLGKKVDDALESETKESLNNWFNKRNKNND